VKDVGVVPASQVGQVAPNNQPGTGNQPPERK
jgi:hypothetical protein